MKTLFLASEVRSGSTYVAELIAYNLADICGESIWGLTVEPFQVLQGNGAPELVRLVLEKFRFGPEGLRAAMLKRTQFEWVEWLTLYDREFEQAFFGPETYWIVLHRRDLIAQAVSLSCAICSGTYHAYAPVPACEPCRATGADLDTALDMIRGCDAVLDRIAARGAHVLRWCYEDVPGSEAALLDAVHRLLFEVDGGFASKSLQGVKLTRAHTDEKARLRARLRARLAARTAAAER